MMEIFLYLTLWWGSGLLGSYLVLMDFKSEFGEVEGSEITTTLFFSLLGPMSLLVGVLFLYLLKPLSSIDYGKFKDWLNK